MRRALDAENEHKSMAEVKKNISVKDTIGWSAEAWRDVTQYTIRLVGTRFYLKSMRLW